MFALRLYAPEGPCLEDVPESTYGTDKVKIRAKNCSACGTDVKIRKDGHQNLTPPRIIGHEIVGEVVEVGSEVAGDWKPDDRVQVIAAVPCRRCHECRKGWMAVCQNQTSVGYQYNGGSTEHMIVPREVLTVDDTNRTPDGVDFVEASAAEPFACAINAQEQLGIEPGDDATIFDAGPIGCLHVHIARGVRRVGRIILVDTNSERLKMSADAAKLDVVINASEANIVEEILKLTGGWGVGVIITATPANVTWKQAVSMAARNGKISFFGRLPKTNPTITLDSNLVHHRQLHIHGANGSAPEHNRRALDHVVNGEVSMANLITRRIRLRDVMDAFRIIEHDEAIKVTVES